MLLFQKQKTKMDLNFVQNRIHTGKNTVAEYWLPLCVLCLCVSPSAVLTFGDTVLTGYHLYDTHVYS